MVDKPPFICPHCGRRFDTEKGLESHKGQKHDNKKEDEKFVQLNVSRGLRRWLRSRKRRYETYTNCIWRLVDRGEIRIDLEAKIMELMQYDKD